MPDNHRLRLTLVLRVPDSKGAVETMSVSKMFDASEIDAQRAWTMEVRARWPMAEIVMKDGPQGRALMQILDDMRCAHDNLEHECPVCANV
jgi:hypothetical protein